MATYAYPHYPYRPPHDLQGPGGPVRKPLIVVGAGPVGLAAAIDARLHGLEVLVLDEDQSVSVGSRAVCYAKRTLEILDRLGLGDFACNKGVSWNVGRTFLQEREVYRFDLVPEPGHKRPGMVNLQQYHLEEALVARAQEVGADLRWKHKVVAVEPLSPEQGDGARLTVETPDGTFQIEADWLVVADGARSPIRRALGLDIEGHVFQDRFLIADVVMKADFPAERWFWFDPPFHPNQSVLLHKQADHVWRIDFQLGWDADPEEEKKPENILPRVKAMLGDDREFELEWASIYTFQCRRMTRFRHGRLLFVGDAAHQVSPFGARGANSGIQDADDLIWKLALVMQGAAPDRLLDSYDSDRTYAADENIRNSTRSTDFITPKSSTSKTFRAAVLQLAQHHPFARKLVNSGRLSVPSFLVNSPLNTPDADAPTHAFAGRMVPGAPLDDAPVLCPASPSGTSSSAGNSLGSGWLLDQLGGRFAVLLFAADATTGLQMLDRLRAPLLQDAHGLPARLQPEWLLVLPAGSQVPAPQTGQPARLLIDQAGHMAQRFDARPGNAYLIRPDQHVAARWRTPTAGALHAALERAVGLHGMVGEPAARPAIAA
jgi:3-(3-hydroxy-phenyl)propionate hydroxylase